MAVKPIEKAPSPTVAPKPGCKPEARDLGIGFGEGASATHIIAIRQPNVETSKQLVLGNRASFRRTFFGDVFKDDPATPIETPHERDFPPTKGAGAIEEDRELFHGLGLARPWGEGHAARLRPAMAILSLKLGVGVQPSNSAAFAASSHRKRGE